MKHTKRKKKSVFPFLLITVIIIFCVFYTYKNYGNSPKTVSSEPESTDLELIALPLNDGNTVSHHGFTLCYSEEDEQPLWVAYVLTPEELKSRTVEREDNFREDPYIKTGSATLQDYRGSGFDRGHMAPYADLSWSEESADDSFYLSNMSPQNASLNRGKWAELEKLVRSFAKEEPICIVTGPVLSDGPYEKIGKNGVSVPKYYYKVILDYVGDEYKAIGFILPNEKCSQPLSFYVVSVDEVEKRTGLDFFCLLPDDIESVLEASSDYSLWTD